MADFWGLAGTGGPGNPFKRWGAKPPTFWRGLPGPWGLPDSKNRPFPDPGRWAFYYFLRLPIHRELSSVSCRSFAAVSVQDAVAEDAAVSVQDAVAEDAAFAGARSVEFSRQFAQLS